MQNVTKVVTPAEEEEVSKHNKSSDTSLSEDNVLGEGGTQMRAGKIDFTYILSMIDPESEVIDIKTED
jgi:hypothetical protein